MSKLGSTIHKFVEKIFHTGWAPEGQWRPTVGIGDFGGVFNVNFGNGWERGLGGNPFWCGGGNGMVYALIQSYAFALAASGIDVREKNDDGGWSIKTDTVAYRCLRKPNPVQNQVEFITYMVNALFYTGNFYAVAVRNNRNEISQLWPLESSKKRAILSDEGDLYYDASSDYRFLNDGDISALLPARDVLHVKLPTNRDILCGQTPIAHAVGATSVVDATATNAAALARNGNQPSGIISTDLNLSAQQMTELRAKFDEVTKGANRGGVPILGGGMKWYPMSLSSEDTQAIQTYNMGVLDLCRIFRVPPQILGLNDNGAASSVEAMINQWRATGLLFYAELIEAALEGLFKMSANQELRFDFTNIARADFKTEIETLAQGVQNAIFSPNEARNRVGLDSVPYGDEPRVQAQNVRLQDAKPAESSPSAPVQSTPVNDDSDDDDEDDDDELTESEKSALFMYRLNKAMEKACEAV